MSYPSLRIATDTLPGGPWIFGRQVPAQETPEDGALVEVLDPRGRFVGHGLYNGASDIRIRLLSRGKRSDLRRPREFLQRRISSARRLRQRVLRLPEVTDAYRLVHAEGDDLSGLIIDRLGPLFVCEYHCLGFWNLREDIEWVLRQIDPEADVLHRIPKSAARLEGMQHTEPPPGPDLWIREHGVAFPITPGRGHKTGWFCDQRDNRQRVAQFANGRDVLDLCCNAGGFAVSAALRGARRVRAVDLDEDALRRGALAAGQAGVDVEYIHGDAFNVLRSVCEEARRPDLLIVDPHKLISGRARMEEGKRRYLDLNALAFQAAAPGALVATFSCSGALDLAQFLGLCFQAARRAGRGIKVLEIMGAGPDHPQRPEFPRSRYLKGALLALDG